jgi:hypothetical protein
MSLSSHIINNMSLSSHIINNMDIKTLLKYLNGANKIMEQVFKIPISHSIRINSVTKYHTIKLVVNIMTKHRALEELNAEYELNKQSLSQATMEQTDRYVALLDDINLLVINLKGMLIDLLDNDFDNIYVKKLSLGLNDFIDPSFLLDYAKNKLAEVSSKRPELLHEASIAKGLAYEANKLRTIHNNIDHAWEHVIDLDKLREQEKMVNNYIAQASAIFHGIDEYMHNLSKNKAGKIIKRRIRRTKRRNINNRNSRKYRKYRKYRNSTRRTH